MFFGRLELEKIEKWLNSKGIKDLEFDLKPLLKMVILQLLYRMVKTYELLLVL